MTKEELQDIWKQIGSRFKSHPWHGINIGVNAPEVVTSFIEIVPSDTVKYEVDKESGYLTVDRPQKFSNIIPALYGFLPQTYCAEEVAKTCMEKLNRTDIVGDNDPLDICVLTERAISHGNLLVPSIPIGGFRMIDGGEADDKIIAVLKGDEVYNWNDISEVPESIINRLRHYFETYKDMPGTGEERKIEIAEVYGREEAYAVIKASQKDYEKHYGNLETEITIAAGNALEAGKKLKIV
ncbi:MAG: inorganic pyrophosphatase [Candidatus Azotimanducaceae bacterium]|jgi:inorganic pyrophosphatase